MNKQIIVRDFSELKYVLKSGHPPVKKDKVDLWQVYFMGKPVYGKNTYRNCQNWINQFKVTPEFNQYKIKP